MHLPRFSAALRPRPIVVLGLVGLAAVVAVAYAWTVVTPTVGEPYVPQAATGDLPLWSFGFVGDTQQADDRLDPLMAAFERHGVEFVLHLGDMVDEATSDLEWDRLVASAMKHRVRLMPVVGNHDVRSDYTDDGSQRFRQYFPDLPNTFYHFRHRGLNFLMLNSERSFAPTAEQAAFLRWHLQYQSGTSIVCLHRPTFTASDRDRGSMFARRLWLHGALAGTDVAAVLSGHNHYYERTRPLDGLTYVVSGGGGGAQREPPAANAQTAQLVGGKNHYGLAQVYADRIETTIFTLDDERLDAFTLPLVAAKHKQGGLHNRHSMELPPLAELPQYRREILEARRIERPQMPRP
jgi:predicted phosphodiesterase